MTEKRKGKRSIERKKEKVPIHQIKIKVIGIGGGAGSIISDIAGKYKGVKFYVADTDILSLARFKRRKGITILHIGGATTKGMGTGMDVNLGKEAVEKDKKKIEEVLTGCDLCVFISCLGGGTGSGVTPVFAEISKKIGNIGYGIFTLPFNFERERKLQVAKNALEELGTSLDIISIIPNQQIFKLVDEKTPIRKALLTINNSLGLNLEGLIQMIHRSGLINIDFADLETILRKKKALAYLTRVKARGKKRVERATQRLINDPLYSYNLSQANGILFNIRAPHNLSLAEVTEISEKISKATKKRKIRIIFGVDLNQKGNDLDITLLAVGCEAKIFSPVKKRPKRKQKKEIKRRTEGTRKGKKGDDKIKKEFDVSKRKKKREEVKSTLKEKVFPEKKKMEEESSKRKKTSRHKKIRKNALQVQKDIKVIEKELLEKEKKWEVPAFLRKKETH